MPLTEIRYRVVGPPEAPFPFAPWFEREPRGLVHVLDVTFEGAHASSRYLATGLQGPAMRRFAEDVLKTPAPGSTHWALEDEQPGFAMIQAEWREPMFPGVRSPMKVHWDTLGPGIVTSGTIRPREVVQRILVPTDAPIPALWNALRDELMRFAGFAQAHLRIELDRLGPWPRTQETEAAAVLRAAFALGYYDTPPSATIVEVCHLAGVPEEVARTRLSEYEAEILGEERFRSAD